MFQSAVEDIEILLAVDHVFQRTQWGGLGSQIRQCRIVLRNEKQANKSLGGPAARWA
jgi:hypothetical protein